MAKYRIRERKHPKRVYANGDDGWVGGVKPPPANPEDSAMLFESQDAAAAYIAHHDMDAEPEKVG